MVNGYNYSIGRNYFAVSLNRGPTYLDLINSNVHYFCTFNNWVSPTIHHFCISISYDQMTGSKDTDFLHYELDDFVSI